jgi:hypothetical protein
MRQLRGLRVADRAGELGRLAVDAGRGRPRGEPGTPAAGAAQAASAPTAAISRNGRLVAPAPASTPPTAGPIIIPTEAHVTEGPIREPPCAASISASQAMPVVHTTP